MSRLNNNQLIRSFLSVYWIINGVSLAVFGLFLIQLQGIALNLPAFDFERLISEWFNPLSTNLLYDPVFSWTLLFVSILYFLIILLPQRALIQLTIYHLIWWGMLLLLVDFTLGFFAFELANSIESSSGTTTTTGVVINFFLSLLNLTDGDISITGIFIVISPILFLISGYTLFVWHLSKDPKTNSANQLPKNLLYQNWLWNDWDDKDPTESKDRRYAYASLVFVSSDKIYDKEIKITYYLEFTPFSRIVYMGTEENDQTHILIDPLLQSDSSHISLRLRYDSEIFYLQDRYAQSGLTKRLNKQTDQWEVVTEEISIVHEDILLLNNNQFQFFVIGFDSYGLPKFHDRLFQKEASIV